MQPIPTNATKENVHAFAERVAQKLAFFPGDPLEPLISRLGGMVVYRDPVGYQSAVPESIVVNSDQQFTIFLPTMTSVERDRFTIAHELGHFFLHYPMVRERNETATMKATRWINEADRDQQRAEWEANWFAAAFLMPEKQFRTAFDLYGPDINHVSARFVVSAQAAKIRAKNLGLIHG